MNTEEQRLDVIDNCAILLNGILRPFYQKDNTPEGRMITQLKWLKERAENHDLPLPVDPVKLSTLRYVYTNGEIVTLASNPDDPHSIWMEVELPMERLLSLTREGQLLLKPPYYPYAIRYIVALIRLLNTSPRPLDRYELGLIPELKQLKQLLADGKIEPPLMSYFPAYPNFRKVYSLAGRGVAWMERSGIREGNG